MSDSRVFSLIPHRPPFLWVDKIIESTETTITAEKLIPDNLDIFDGHYPGNPLLPGVLICEAIFQTGALLIANLFDGEGGDDGGKVPVLTKITGARFKRAVLPGETVRMSVKLIERISSVCIFKGTARVDGKIAVKTEFSCALVTL